MKKFVILYWKFNYAETIMADFTHLLSTRDIYVDVRKTLDIKQHIPEFASENEAYDWYKLLYKTTDEYCGQNKGFFKSKKNKLPKEIFIIPKYII